MQTESKKFPSNQIRDLSETPKSDRELWDDKAEKWHLQMGDSGDRNRRFHINAVIWKMLGNIEGKRLLDAGCGTGYLSRQLADKGAIVTGIDLSPKMIEVAKLNTQQSCDYRVEDCSNIVSIEPESVDGLVSVYCLQDLPNLNGAISSFHKVLKTQGVAVLIFGHPCFGGDHLPQIEKDDEGNKLSITYKWSEPYFDHMRIEEVWSGHSSKTNEAIEYKTPFTFYHRPLSDYWKCFTAHGFKVVEFDEPVIRPPFPEGMSEAQIRGLRLCPWSVAFRLVKI